jgi:AbrB family looped-hinge helix DNA binding protein
MATTKVTRNYQVTIPSEIRKRVEVKAGDTLLIEYAEEEDAIRLRLPHRGPRKTRRLGRRLTPEDIETSIEEGMRDCLRS